MDEKAEISSHRGQLDAIFSQLIGIGSRIGRLEAAQDTGREYRDNVANALGEFRDQLRDLASDVGDLMRLGVTVKSNEERMDRMESSAASATDVSNLSELMKASGLEIRKLHDWQQRYIGARATVVTIISVTSAVVGAAIDAAVHYFILGPSRR